MGEIDGVRGLVPSNFLSEAPDQYGAQAPTAGSVAQRQLNSRGRGIGPGARGPPPPPRDNMGMGMGMGMGVGMNQRGGPQRKGKFSYISLANSTIILNIFLIQRL